MFPCTSAELSLHRPYQSFETGQINLRAEVLVLGQRLPLRIRELKGRRLLRRCDYIITHQSGCHIDVTR